jgi:hypothetical protein
MKIGYFFNGYLSDKVSEFSKDSPDGNAWYSAAIIDEFLNQGHEVYLLGVDKDAADYTTYGDSIFNSFEKKKRVNVYKSAKYVEWEFNKDKCNIKNLPQLDFILLEWRFPIPGRNTLEDVHTDNFQYDLLMQNYILQQYNCPITIFDLDYKITLEDEHTLQNKKNIKIIETAINPTQKVIPRMSVDIPFWMHSDIIQNSQISKYKDLVYIGSRYERDRSIEQYLVPYSQRELFKVWVYGNWRKYTDKYDELYTTLNWRDIQYHDRVGHTEFESIYSDSLCCPLLAKDEYYKNGFMTARIQECLYFGSIPIGFQEHLGIEKYLPESLIAKDFEDFYKKVQQLKSLSIFDRNKFRNTLWKHLEFMDVSNFTRIILGDFK